jgi:hypothetical protein
MVMLKLADDDDYNGEIRCILLVDGEDYKVSRDGDRQVMLGVDKNAGNESLTKREYDRHANGNAHDLKIQMVHMSALGIRVGGIYYRL